MPQSTTRTAFVDAPDAYDPLEVLAFALTAPVPKDLTPAQIGQRLTELFDEAGGRRNDACRELVERLAALASASDAALADAALRCHPGPDTLAEDIYALRAFADDPKAAAKIAEMRRYLANADVPEAERELALDRAIADGQVSYALLVEGRKRGLAAPRESTLHEKVAERQPPHSAVGTDPKRIHAAVMAFDHFRSVYARRYEEFHAAYWATASQQHARLLDAHREVQALKRLNSLVELGAPVGAETIGSYQALIEATTVCEPGVDLATALKTDTVCPGCGLRPGDPDRGGDVEATLGRLVRSIERQLSRLSCVAVEAILGRSNDPRVGRFLRVVQAAQITTLTEILDDDLVGYLRRFLLEARISTLLEPIFDHVQHGTGDPAATRDSLEKLAELLHRAVRGVGQASDDAPTMDPSADKQSGAGRHGAAGPGMLC